MAGTKPVKVQLHLPESREALQSVDEALGAFYAGQVESRLQQDTRTKEQLLAVLDRLLACHRE